MDGEEVNLGFLAETASQNLRRWLFPSKLGGLPAWPEPRRLPPVSHLTCNACAHPQTFILQIYAPIEDCEAAFHRTLLLFGCMQCGGVYTLLRCQMPRENRVYPSYPLSDIDASLFWMKWRDILALSSFSKQSSQGEELGNSSKERKSLRDAHPSSEKEKNSKDEPRHGGETKDRDRQEERKGQENHVKPLSSSSCSEREERKKRESGEDDLTCDIERLQRQERFLSQHTCPVCGLPSILKKGEESDGRKDAIDGENKREEEKEEEKKKDTKDRELREKKIFELLHEREIKQEHMSVIDLDVEDALVEETKHRASLGVDCLHKRCEIFLEHRGRGLCCALPEFELEVAEEEDEGGGENRAIKEDYTHEEELYKKYREEETSHPDAVLDESEQEAFEEIHNERSTLDPQLLHFLKRCSSPASSRGHVLRYALGGRPLWPFSTNQLATDPPPCDRCGAPRQFECQVQPQLLFELKKFFDKREKDEYLATSDSQSNTTRTSKGHVDQTKEKIMKEREKSKTSKGGGEDMKVAHDEREACEEKESDENQENRKVLNGQGKEKKEELKREDKEGDEKKKEKNKTKVGNLPREVVRKDPRMIAREEAAEVASERLHFAVLCLYTCSAHCTGEGKIKQDSRKKEEEQDNQEGREGNQKKLDKAASFDEKDEGGVYPYTIEYVYVQPDPFYAMAKEKKKNTTL
ncbi:programmed cell death protein c-terminal domain-containing protein [Cystoisospora suis]|uniref:Programmed cell death protein c-terminal domain-containing protein n=1 Tax=Cystoisospora suis TaxID=483139 RepID=A0A2C6L5P8_9APIC|nr:programmed cell death protein c-terminal domain-containing protein [Cystoisospora suis]